jgi:hypothetical protein
MIAYDLQCEQGHAFEGWFDAPEAFEAQLENGQLTCPVCGSSRIVRLLSTFGISKNRSQSEEPAQTEEGGQVLAQIVRYVQDNFEDVGSNFAKEALKMHYGVSETRNIRGVSSDQEEKTLKDEGVEFFKLPVLAGEEE